MFEEIYQRQHQRHIKLILILFKKEWYLKSIPKHSLAKVIRKIRELEPNSVKHNSVTCSRNANMCMKFTFPIN